MNSLATLRSSCGGGAEKVRLTLAFALPRQRGKCLGAIGRVN
jgi:hypothetical protein